jgi:hypothetical protein
MVRFRDFTKVPAGVQIFDSEVQKCPHCGKTGLVEENAYLHTETIGTDEKQHHVMKWETCPRP